MEGPKIIKRDHQKIIWIPEDDRNENIRYKPYEDKWYKEYLEPETIKFAQDKEKLDIQKMSTQEYAFSQLKYLDEEYVRQNEYINPKYHSKIK